MFTGLVDKQIRWEAIAMLWTLKISNQFQSCLCQLFRVSFTVSEPVCPVVARLSWVRTLTDFPLCPPWLCHWNLMSFAHLTNIYTGALRWIMITPNTDCGDVGKCTLSRHPTAYHDEIRLRRTQYAYLQASKGKKNYGTWITWPQKGSDMKILKPFHPKTSPWLNTNLECCWFE